MPRPSDSGRGPLTDDRYKWVALSNTTLAVFMSQLDGSIVIISLPAIFRGIHLDPLGSGNISYLLGGAMLTANSAAILTDAFLATQRGLALGINQVAGIGGQFIGLVAGGLLAALDWRAVFWVNVPVGVIGTVWAYRRLRERVAEPMFALGLFRIRAFAAGGVAGLIAAAARGGLQFMLIIWLQGIWLPLHGYAYTDTPLWAGIYLLPLSASFLISGPVSGFLSDRFGARGFATAGMLVFGASFIGLMLLPVDFPYWAFALLIVVNGIGVGLFGAPNSSAVMGSVPARQRGAASGMRSTFRNSGTALSIGVFFSLMIAGLAGSLPRTLTGGLQQQGVPHAVAHQVGSLPPVTSLFAAVLGFNPVGHLLAPSGVLATLPSVNRQTLTGHEFFPRLISALFHRGLTVVFLVAAALSVLAAVASPLRGGHEGATPASARPPAEALS